MKRIEHKIHVGVIATLTLVCLILPQAAALAATYYVDANGNDNNPGTIGQPWQTIQKAANTLAPSDTVIVNSGNYDEAVSIKKSGSTGNPITYRAEGQVITKGFVVEADYIHIIGFEVTNVPDNMSAGISVKGHYNQILGNYIHHTSDEANGILIVGHWPQWGDIYNESTNNLVKGNRIEYARECGIKTFGTNNIIEKNDISHTITYGDADGIRFFGKGHIVRKNYIHDITIEEAGGAPHIDCFQTWGPAIDVLFEGNLCELLKPPPETSYQIAMISSMSEMNSPVKNLTFRNNIFKSSSNGYCPLNIHGGIPKRIEDVFILHNTFIRDSGRGAYGVRLIDVTNAVVKNNIFYDTANNWASYISPEEECENLDIGNNLIYMSDNEPIAGSPYPNDLWLINPRFFGNAR